MKNTIKIACLLVFIIGYALMGATHAAPWNLPGIKIITRAQRGADESIRYAKQPQYKVKERLKEKNESELEQLAQTNVDEFFDRSRKQYEKSMANDYLVTKYASAQTVDEVRYEYLGNYLKRPESIHKKKIEVIIHHTASDYTSLLTGGDQGVKKYLQNVYKFHAITRGRGDVGYNFLIDPFGNIYEGRAGGESVIGAHTAWNNTPSLGISLMGNFEINQPTEAQLKALISLTTALAKKYNIDPAGRAMYFTPDDDEPPYLKERENYTVAGHRDAGVTSCPGANLYVLLPIIREKITTNLSKIKLTSVKIKNVKGANTGVVKPVTPGTIIPGFYYSNKTTDTFSLPTAIAKDASCTSADDTLTVNSCSMQGSKLILSITKSKPAASGLKTFIIKSGEKDIRISFLLMWQDDANALISSLKENYVKYRMMASPDGTMSKISHQIQLDEAKQYMAENIKVLLYELTKNYDRREFTCEGKCKIETDKKSYIIKDPVIESHDGFLYLTIGEDIITSSKMTVSSNTSGLVAVDNYKRKSYANTVRNTFRGSLIFQKDKIKNLKTSLYDEQYVIINELKFTDYMKGIGETSETENIQKIKLMGLIAKSYALFYMNPLNKHPSIPAGAGYTAIDSPDMFQKYVGAGAEKTFKIYQSTLTDTKNQILIYNGYVPILPYFSCSAGFTFSAQEKRGRSDTPYLQSRIDVEKCDDFKGHGVGLSGKGAQYLAEKGRDYKAILEYYYPGVEVKSF